MPFEHPPSTWLSAHIHFQGGHIYSALCDQVIEAVVKPFVHTCTMKKHISRFFFIRYSEHGPHVRLRFFGNTDALEQEVKPALLDHLAISFPKELRPTATTHPAIKDPALPIAWVPYCPEIMRYGGVRGIRLAEDFFYSSSQAALALLSQMQEGHHALRLGKGALAMVALLKVFLPEKTQAVAFAHYYCSQYLRSISRQANQHAALLEAFEEGFRRQAPKLVGHVQKLWDLIESGEALPDALARYTHDLGALQVRFAALQQAGQLTSYTRLSSYELATYSIIPSYVHMMNNRLGISIPDEAYLAFLVAQALLQPAPSVPA